METIYCSLAFTGLAGFFSTGYVKTAMELFSVAFLLFLGGKFLTAEAIPAAGKMRERFEERLHPRSPFMTGFVRVMGNPGVLLLWIILGANFIAREWVRPRLGNKGACVLGVALGTSLWFLAVSYAVSFGHRKFSEKTLLRMEHGSGVGLLLLGLFHGGQLIWELAKARHHR
jgi:threonine/homoserine/homoserine lactone efflux protein